MFAVASSGKSGNAPFVNLCRYSDIAWTAFFGYASCGDASIVAWIGHDMYRVTYTRKDGFVYEKN